MNSEACLNMRTMVRFSESSHICLTLACAGFGGGPARGGPGRSDRRRRRRWRRRAKEAGESLFATRGYVRQLPRTPVVGPGV